MAPRKSDQGRVGQHPVGRCFVLPAWERGKHGDTTCHCQHMAVSSLAHCSRRRRCCPDSPAVLCGTVVCSLLNPSLALSLRVMLT
eukprot:353149-Chlamydomonas_euryale.AAC.13